MSFMVMAAGSHGKEEKVHQIGPTHVTAASIRMQGAALGRAT